MVKNGNIFAKTNRQSGWLVAEDTGSCWQNISPILRIVRAVAKYGEGAAAQRNVKLHIINKRISFRICCKLSQKKKKC